MCRPRSSFLRTLMAALSGLVLCNTVIAQPDSWEIKRNVVYGTGIIAASSKPFEQELTLDAYIPNTSGTEAILRPAVILAFGGAFHRGEKGDFQFKEDGASDSSMDDLCVGISVYNPIPTKRC